MKIPRATKSEGAVINITSLLDVMFILLIFFMATTTFRQEEFDEKVKLPEAQSERTTLSDAPKVIVINVRRAGGEVEGPVYVVGSRQVDLKQVHGLVKDAVESNVNQKILIRGDKYAYHGHVANAIATCRSAGVSEVNIGYEYKTTN